MTAQEKVNILLVDDQPSKLLSYEVILQPLGENLLKAASGTEALEQLLKHEVAVVLVDVCMPDLDGFELAAMIREHPRCQNTAIIFISAIHLTDTDRLRGYEMGGVDYVPVPVVAEVLRAKVRIFIELYRKTRQLEDLNSELEDRVAARTVELESYAAQLLKSEERRSLALAAGKMGSWDWDIETGDCMWDEGQCRIFGVEPVGFKPTPERIKALLDPADWDRLTEIWADGAPSGSAFETEFSVQRPDGEVRWCFGTAAATRDRGGRIVRLGGVTIDITDRKGAEERQAFLAREVDHRARNVLAVAQSILRLTKADTMQTYVEAVEGRIRALSRAHSLLSETRWEGADLKRLLNEELEPYRAAGTVSASGPELLLDARSAQTIALAVHELATNAAKYGALNCPSGRLQLNWRSDTGQVLIEWLETNNRGISAPATQGYGMKVIRASLEQLGGKAEFDWRPDGLCCTLSLARPNDARVGNGKGIEPRLKVAAAQFPLPVSGNAILLVEDESVVAIMMSEALKELGFDVVGPYATLAEAIAAKNSRRVDGAILDINLGNHLVYPLAAILENEGTPLVFITGYGAESVEQHYRHIPLLQKPIDRRALQNLFTHGKHATGTEREHLQEPMRAAQVRFSRL
jgi:two-component sensor histidine kinase/two-component SAPR family response regulator